MSDDFPNRQTTRLPGYDYSGNGYYFLTICSQNRENVFGEIINGKMVLNDVGKMIDHWLNEIPKKYPTIKLDIYQIMPDHIHVIIIVGADLCVCPKKQKNIVNGRTHRCAPTLGNIIQWFKTMSTNEYIVGVKNNNWPKFHIRLWQRNYYEHIIRDEKDYYKIREYIINNPKNWGIEEDV